MLHESAGVRELSIAGRTVRVVFLDVLVQLVFVLEDLKFANTKCCIRGYRKLTRI